MKKFCLSAFALTIAGIGLAHAQDDEDVIKNAMSAAPEAIGLNAKVVTFNEEGELVTLREGTNNFTCFPDDPNTPANDPMCADENATAWTLAWINKTDPPTGDVGFAYMLQGGSTPGNLDPYATEPPEGEDWLDEPPHVMIFNLSELPEDYPNPGANPDVSQPWVMWPGTPYEHLMLPVE